MSKVDASTRYADLVAKLPRLEEHVLTISMTVGHFDELNKTAGSIKATEAARHAAGAIRNSLLRFLAISAAAAFASPKYPKDVSLKAFADALKDARFVTLCVNDRKKETIDRLVEQFLRDYAAADADYKKVKPLRDRALAHVSQRSYTRPKVKSVLDLARASVALTERLLWIVRQQDVTISSLEDSGRMHVRALQRGAQQQRKKNETALRDKG